MRQLNVSADGRQNVGRVDHLVLGYPSVAARDAARDQFSERLNITGWSEIGEIADAGIHVVVDWDSGIELLAAVAEPNMLQGREGFHTFVFGVDDLDAAMERARAAGVRVNAFPPAPPATYERFEVGREAVIPARDMGGIQVVLGEFKPLPGHELTLVDDRGRMHPGAIDHLVFCFADEALLRSAQATFTSVLGLGEWTELGVLEGGFKVVINVAAGLEFICPVQEGTFLADHIQRHGSVSLFGLVFATPDVDAAVDRVRAAGGKGSERPMHPTVLADLQLGRHVGIGRVGGVMTTLSEIVHRAS